MLSSILPNNLFVLTPKFQNIQIQNFSTNFFSCGFLNQNFGDEENEKKKFLKRVRKEERRQHVCDASCDVDCDQKYQVDEKCCFDPKTTCLRRKFHSKEILQNFNKTSNYFQLLNIPVQYEVNKNDLEKIYKLFQRKYHPDLNMNLSNEEKEISRMQTSLINSAYLTLKNDQARARYLLKLKLEEQSNDSEKDIDNVKIEEVQLPEEFLFHMFTQLQEVENSSDEQIDIIKEKYKLNNEEIQEVVQEIGECFKNNELEEVKTLLAILNYLIRLNDSLKEEVENFDLKF